MQVALDGQFNQTVYIDLCIDTSIKGFKVYIMGDLAFYAAVLGKPSYAGSWCTWCDARKSYFGFEDLLQGAVKWTCEKLREAKCIFDGQTTRSKKNHK